MALPTVKCLLVDDDLDDQEIFDMAVKKIDSSIECHFAEDGWFAISKLNSDKDFVPAYIFIDMNMPRLNGIGCLLEIRKIDRLKKVPVYIYSTSVDDKIIEEPKLFGAVGFITKQTSLKALVNTLQTIFRR